MKKIVIASMRSNAGKTSIIAGIISLVKDKKFAYAKPLGDRLIYRRKRSWDYDASLMVNLLKREGELESHYEKITLGFDHSRLKYMYDQEGIKKALSDIVKDIGGKNDVLFIESGKDLTSGAYLNLDPLSITKYVDGKLVIVVNGDGDSILDDIKFIEKYMKMIDVNFGGVIINKVSDSAEFEHSCTPSINEMGINILGVIPYKAQLTYFTLDFLAEKLMARVLAGEENLKKVVKNIIIGKPLTAAPDNQPLPLKPGREESQLMITGGDKSDMILAALERDTVGIILTNDIVPHQNIISRANERGIPILLVGTDTFKTAKTIDDIEALLKKDDTEKIQLLSQLIEKYTRVEDFLK
ncbi:MAG: DRTGG domain-containing protein [Deltaproteobacteria bacterium]|nr:DRTGG domain-containing protein [Deltaproteobacteria bacterium]